MKKVAVFLFVLLGQFATASEVGLFKRLFFWIQDQKNIERMSYDGRLAYKFDFSAEASRKVADVLQNLRVSSKTAYPDLEGLAKSVIPKLY